LMSATTSESSSLMCVSAGCATPSSSTSAPYITYRCYSTVRFEHIQMVGLRVLNTQVVTEAKKSIMAEKISGFISPHDSSSDAFVTVTKSGPKNTALTPSMRKSALARGDFILWREGECAVTFQYNTQRIHRHIRSNTHRTNVACFWPNACSAKRRKEKRLHPSHRAGVGKVCCALLQYCSTRVELKAALNHSHCYQRMSGVRGGGALVDGGTHGTRS
jgi:hypothetical protein